MKILIIVIACQILDISKKNPNSLSLFSQERFSSSLSIFRASGLLQKLYIFPMLGAPSLDTVFQLGAHKGRAEYSCWPPFL